jgi:hypothetical protein
MDDEKIYDCKRRHHYHHATSSSNGAVYGLGFIGAAIFFVIKATTFWMGVIGILKALVWPAILVFYALRALGV